MWNWITRVLGGAVGVVDETIRRWVGGLISGVFGFIHAVFHLVGGAYDDVLNGTEWLAAEVASFVREVYGKFQWIVHIALQDIIRWADNFIRLVLRYAEDVYRIVLHEFDLLRHDIAHWLDDLRHWVITDIWDPIVRVLDVAYHWVTHEGALVYHYITHPADLIDLLWEALLVKIEREAWNIGKLLGRFFLSLIIHNLKMFVLLLEDIVDAVF